MTKPPPISVRNPDNPLNPKDAKLLREALIPAGEAWRDLPTDNLRLRFLTSLVVSYVMNAADPHDAFAKVFGEATLAIGRAMVQERERGGTA